MGNVIQIKDFQRLGATKRVDEFEGSAVRANKDFGECDGPALVSDGTEGFRPSTDDMQTRYPTPTGLLEGDAEPISDVAKRVIEKLEKKRAATRGVCSHRALIAGQVGRQEPG